jgi:carbon monoxide dehydrogenase subunit G
MDFTNTFNVNAPVDQVWGLLLQPEEVTGCVPGAAITEKIDDQRFKGTIKVKLGAVQVTYRGEMEMQPDHSTHTIALAGKGTETRGSGGATGRMTVSLAPEEQGTAVTVESHIDVTGKVATFGRGIMQDVANRLTRQFATCLAAKLEDQPAVAAPGSAAGLPADDVATGSGQREGSSSQAQPAQSNSSQTASAPIQTAASSSADAANELRIVDILADITRARTAAALRTLASWIEPK